MLLCLSTKNAHILTDGAFNVSVIPEGLEPSTHGLKIHCSRPTELQDQISLHSAEALQERKLLKLLTHLKLAREGKRNRTSLHPMPPTLQGFFR